MNKVYLIDASYYNHEDYDLYVSGEDTICAFDSLEKAKAFVGDVNNLADFMKEHCNYANLIDGTSFMDCIRYEQEQLESEKVEPCIAISINEYLSYAGQWEKPEDWDVQGFNFTIREMEVR